MIRIAICDDDPMYLAGARSYVERWQKESHMSCSLQTFCNGTELIEQAILAPFDIIFLDILMPLQDGMSVAKELRLAGSSAKIVFLTTSIEFALDSYSVKASDYLVKPVTYEHMKVVLGELTEAVLSEPDSISVKIAGGYRKLFRKDIEYLEASNKKVIFSMVSGERIQSMEPLYHWEKNLLSDGFFKSHRSYLVNLMNVDYFDSVTLHTRSGKVLPIARGFGKDFESAYFSVMFPQ